MTTDRPLLFDPHHPYKVTYSVTMLLAFSYFLTARVVGLWDAGWRMEALIEGVVVLSMLVSACIVTYECIIHHWHKGGGTPVSEESQNSAASTFGPSP
jgi:hypothetical protein